MKKILKIVYIIIVAAITCYVGGWLMFIKPILHLAALMSGSVILTNIQIFIEVVKVMLATTVISIFVYIATLIYILIFEGWIGIHKKKRGKCDGSIDRTGR